MILSVKCKVQKLFLLLLLPSICYSFEITNDSELDRELEQGIRQGRNATIDLEMQRKAEREQRQSAQRRAANSDMDGSLNCREVGGNYPLWNYCKTGDCTAFGNNYPLWNLCQNGDYSSLPYEYYSYLESGNTGGFSDYRVATRAKQQSGSFVDRKRFIIYLMNGFTYE